MKNYINETFSFFTDTATLAIFDPAVLIHRLNAEPDWWAENFNLLPEVSSGLISLIALSNDGFYKVRLTSEGLTEDEKDFAREVVGPLGLISQTGQIFIGKGECLPAENYLTSADNIQVNEGMFIHLPIGDYVITAYYIDAAGCEGTSKLEKSLPNIVVVIAERTMSFKVQLASEPRFSTTVKTFLFPSAKNSKKRKPKMGLTIKAKVWLSKRTPSGLAIKEEGILPDSYKDYELVLEDMTQIKHGDRLKIKTTRFDEKYKLIYADLLERKPKE